MLCTVLVVGTWGWRGASKRGGRARHRSGLGAVAHHCEIRNLAFLVSPIFRKRGALASPSHRARFSSRGAKGSKGVGKDQAREMPFLTELGTYCGFCGPPAAPML